jgi:membrane protease YdiL (CAAX protease family)
MVFFVPGLFSDISPYLLPDLRSPTGEFLYQSLYDIVRESGRIVLVLYLIFYSADPPSRFGIKRFRIFPDFFGGIAVYLLVKLISLSFWAVIGFLEQHDLITLSHNRYNPFFPPAGPGAYGILALSCLAVAFAEELIFRAYLITRFEKLFDSTGLALLFSTVIFGGINIYKGMHGFLSATLMGLIYGCFFCLFRRLWPLVLSHAIWNFMVFAAMAAFQPQPIPHSF